METKQYTTIDRSDWPSGEWDGEPDKAQWPDPATGLPCLAVRHSGSGHWCGYVGVTEEHRLYGEYYGDVDVEVHGGLTFSALCRPGAEETGVCHVPGEGEPDHVWWFGFDCAHSGDRCALYTVNPMDQYRTLEYVKAECAKLALQLVVEQLHVVIP